MVPELKVIRKRGFSIFRMNSCCSLPRRYILKYIFKTQHSEYRDNINFPLEKQNHITKQFPMKKPKIMHLPTT